MSDIVKEALEKSRQACLSINNDLGLIDYLRYQFSNLKPYPITGVPNSEIEWNSFLNRLIELVLNSDPRSFLNWDVIVKTMFVHSPWYIEKELQELQESLYWDIRWKKVLKEDQIGSPPPCRYYPDSSGNLIHHAYHINQANIHSNIEVTKYGCVLEFGGGYGSMCRLFHKIGFTGKYIIYDLQPFSYLQQYYLKSIGLKVISEDSTENGIICTSDINVLKKHIAPNRNLFLATWSISETPQTIREPILNLIKDFDSFIIAYQHRFCEMDNIEYFKHFQNSIPKNMDWVNQPIDHLPGNSYLFGQVPEPVYNPSL